MSCATCGHTMERFNTLALVWWCPRCGTISAQSLPGDPATVAVPRLVKRCLDYQSVAIADDDPEGFFATEWKRLGIAESINLPGDRPQ